MLAHKVRLALTALSAILGVAFVAGMLMLTGALDRTFTDIFTSTANDVTVTAASAVETEDSFETPALGGFVPQEIVERVRAVPGVADAAGYASGAGLALLDGEGEVVGGQGPPSIGLAWLDNPALSNARIVEGRPPQRVGEVAVDTVTYPRLGLPIGSPVELAGPRGRFTAELVGVFELGAGGGQAGLTLTALPAQQAQELFAEPGQWISVPVQVEEGRGNAEVAAAIREAIGPRYNVSTREEQVDAAVTALQQGLGFINTIIGVFAGISLFVAAFLIYNTFSMLIAQRGRELALLRAVGATRGQVLASVLVEAVVIALFAAFAGLLLGYALARGLIWLLGLIGLELSSSVGFTGQAVLWSVLLALLVITGSAAAPALRAARIPPVAALRDVGRAAETAGLWRTVLGAVLAVVAGFGLWRAFAVAMSATATAWFAAAALIAAILLAPGLARALSSLFAVLLGRISGVTGRIAARNTGRSPRRIAATASALMIGLALVAGVSVIVSSAQRSVSDLVDRIFIGDLLITRNEQRFSPAVAEAVAQVPGVGLVLQQTSGPAQLGERVLEVSGLGIVGDAALLESALPGVDVDGLVSGRALLGDETAAELDLGEGDRLDLLLPSGRAVTVDVAAVIDENPLLGGLVLPIAEYREAGGERDDRRVFVAFDGTVPRADAERAVREAVAFNPLLTVESQTELKDRNQQQLDRLLYLVFAMLGLSIVIAALGVVNTMALSVVERTREIGLLRAVGASRGQVRRMIRWEAVLVSLLGGLPGIAIGVVVGAALQRALAEQGLDVLAIPWGELAGMFAAAVLIGVLGAVLPGRRASRLNILDAIAAE